MVVDYINCIQPDSAISLLFNILASKMDKESEDFKDLVVVLVDHVNQDKNADRVKKTMKNDSRLNQINNILVNEYDGKKINVESKIYPTQHRESTYTNIVQAL